VKVKPAAGIRKTLAHLQAQEPNTGSGEFFRGCAAQPRKCDDTDLPVPPREALS
jgi:hypothetical protein